MSTFKSFEEIEAWQKVREFINGIHTISYQGMFPKDFALRKQIRKASVSIMSNIAEGFERDGTAEFLQFLAIAKGSTGEVITQLYIALDLGYINKETFNRIFALTIEISCMICKSMNYLQNTKINGTK